MHPLKPRRRIVGQSAILLPFTPGGDVDWPAFRGHVARTAAAGLTPAVNMDTGYVNLLDDATKADVLRETADVLSGGSFVAGAFVSDTPTAAFDLDGYRRAIDAIQARGGTPVIFPSFGLTSRDPDGILEAYGQIAEGCPRFIGFELGTMFAPFGRVFDLPTYERLLGIPQCVGAKHSSLSREQEWQRLEVRDRVRPDFHVFTGNDLAIDMVMYGSDYLLGLSTCAPDLFAKRDAFWRDGDDRFYELNDLLQYLGFFLFRPPVPAYKHGAAMLLHLRGWIGSDRTHPNSPARPDGDRAVLADIAGRLAAWAG